MPRPVSHVVKRPGRKPEDPDLEIPVAEDLAGVPGVPLIDADVSFYSRVEPLESQTIEKGADRDWVWTVYSDEMARYKKAHDERSKPLVEAAAESASVVPFAAPEPGKDITEDIRRKCREMGFGEVGFTKYDRRYTYASKKGRAKFRHAICLALEQDYDQTQTIASMEAEYTHYGTYEVEGALGLELAAYIRSLGYRAQIHSPSDPSAAFIPMFVSAGLGQLGANGQLLSPHFGSRSRLMIVTTDGPVTYDKPVDYGFHKFCQVCVNRCLGRALVKQKVMWWGVEKNKLIYDRCRPVMARYDGCGVCMKVCPVQEYGMKAVMEEYVETGEVLGKGTDDLEGYTLPGRGYFGPGKLPHFDHDFFEFPHGRREDWLSQQFKDRLATDGAPTPEELTDFALWVKTLLKTDPSELREE